VYKAKQKLFEKVAEKWKTTADDIDCQDGTVFSKSDSSRKMAWKEAAALIRKDTIITLGEHIRGEVPEAGTGAYGAQFAEVEVDTETGKVRVIKIVAVQDVGKTIAKAQAESQMCGAVIQGVTSALLEDRIMDNMTGRQLNANLEDYKILTAMDTPEIEPVMVDVFDPINNASAKGLGEPPYIPTAAAIGCAVANALGTPVRRIPFTADMILAALQKKEG